MKIVVVIPAFDEAPRIAAVVRGVIRAGFRDVIVVDDGSRDDTTLEAAEAGARVVLHPINCGAGAAVKTGLELALRLGADAAVMLDADGQHDPAEIGAVLAPVQAGKADLSLGVRLKDRGTMPAITRLFNLAGNLVTFFLSGIWVKDSQSGFRALSKAAMTLMEVEGSGFEFCTEMIMEAARLGLRIEQVPIRTIYTEAARGKGQNYSTGLKTVFKLLVRSLMR